MIYFEEGRHDMSIKKQRISELLDSMLSKMGKLKRVLILPPDITRLYSYAGEITCMLFDKLKNDCHIEIMPATGTHFPLTPGEMDLMFPGVPHELFKGHDWKRDVMRIGTIPPETVKELTDGLVDFSIHCELNKSIVTDQWDQIISVGQLVPHELAGIANYNKNLFIGVGGKDIIDKTHFIGAMYGLEKLMGRISSPVRKVLDYMSAHFTSHLPVSYILTIRGMGEEGQLVTRGVYAGNDVSCYLRGAVLCQKVNIHLLNRSYSKVITYLDPGEFKSTWVCNKAIYRTRMAVAGNGELIVLCPGIKSFGEDPVNDAVIRKYGYQNMKVLLKLFEENGDLSEYLTPLSHLLISSPEDRFRVTYGIKNISGEEMRAVHCNYADYDELTKKYNPFILKEGENIMPDGEEVFFVSKPSQGLWAEIKTFNK